MKQSTNFNLLKYCLSDCLLAKALFPFDDRKVCSLCFCYNRESHENRVLWLFIDLSQTIVCAHSDYLLSFHVTPSLVSFTSKPALARASRISSLVVQSLASLAC